MLIVVPMASIFTSQLKKKKKKAGNNFQVITIKYNCAEKLGMQKNLKAAQTIEMTQTI